MHSDNEKPRLPVVSADWLKSHLHDECLRIVDASWHLPATERDAQTDFYQGHIPGAVFFDIDKHSAKSHLPHMLPDAQQFSRAAGSLGIAEHHFIVVYDSVGLFSSARVWWMFRHFGAANVYVLDGGLPAWLRCGGELNAGAQADKQTTNDGRFSACQYNVESALQDRQKELADIAAVQDAMNDNQSIILDARPAGRFSGVEKEARAGLRSGHIPGSLSMPFTQVLNENGELKTVSELEQLFDNLQLHEGVHVVTSCGSGVTAAVLCLALQCVGHDNVALYDGSWSEWGGLAELPIAQGS